ncbi:LACS7, partial [Symbiodinium necroappetens]
MSAELDTFPKLLLHHAEVRPKAPAMREKDYGIWLTSSWGAARAEIEALACGLHQRGFRRGDRLAIVGDNRPRLYWAMCAAQALGGVPDFLHHYEALVAEGRDFARRHPQFFADEVAKGRGGDVSIMCYTSGTTGNPKGVVLTFDNVLQSARNGAEFEGLSDKEDMLAYLPMAWVGDHIFSYAQSYAVGFCVSCPESGATVMQDLRELGPTYFFDASAIKRRAFHYFMGVARRAGIRILNGQPVPLGDRLLYALGELLVYGPLKNTLGLTRVRLAYTAGEAIGPDIFDFYRSLGVNLKQLYGSTEASVFVTIQPDGEIYADTVGKPAPGVE